LLYELSLTLWPALQDTAPTLLKQAHSASSKRRSEEHNPIHLRDSALRHNQSNINRIRSQEARDEICFMMLYCIDFPLTSQCTIVGIHSLNHSIFKLRSRNIPRPMNLTRKSITHLEGNHTFYTFATILSQVDIQFLPQLQQLLPKQARQANSPCQST
jgi:hypothetical protein